MPKRLLAPTLALFLLLAASAQAAEVRYASPTGGDAASCAQATPCSLKTAMQQAPDGSEIVVGPGTYAIGEQLRAAQEASTPRHVFLHGDFGAPMPTIEYSPSKSSNSTGIAIDGEHSVVSWLRIKGVGEHAPALDCEEGAVAERVVVESQSASDPALRADHCSVHDTLTVETGSSGTAIDAVDSTITNVTALATGEKSVAILTSPSDFIGDPPVSTVNIVNTIARGGSDDIEAYEEEPAEPSETFVSYSNFDPAKLTENEGKIIQKAGNQSALPLFANAAGGDYTEAPGSPTIDAGIATSEAGPLDLAGNARVQGGVIDIGAYELPHAAPPPPPPPAKTVEGKIEKLSVLPRSFSPTKSGGAVISRKKPRGPVGGSVVYTLSADATVTFSLEAITEGRKAGKRCVKQTKSNKGKRACDLFKPLRGSFANQGGKGLNTFNFSGRLNDKPLAPGRYLLVARAGGATKTALFSIVR